VRYEHKTFINVRYHSSAVRLRHALFACAVASTLARIAQVCNSGWKALVSIDSTDRDNQWGRSARIAGWPLKASVSTDDTSVLTAGNLLYRVIDIQ